MAATAENAPGNWGLIAGNGDFPFLVLEGARSRGIEMAVIAIREEASPALERAAQPLPLDQPRRTQPRNRSAASGRSKARGDGRAGEAQQDFQLDSAGLAPREAALFASQEEYGLADRSRRARAGRRRHRARRLHQISRRACFPPKACSRGARPTQPKRRTSPMGSRSRGRLPGSTWDKRWSSATAPAWPSKPWKAPTKPSSAPRGLPTARGSWS